MRLGNLGNMRADHPFRNRPGLVLAMQIAALPPPSINFSRVCGAGDALVKIRWQQVEMRTRRARCASSTTSTPFSTLASAVGVYRLRSRTEAHLTGSSEAARWQGDVLSDSHRCSDDVRVRERPDYPCSASCILPARTGPSPSCPSNETNQPA
jgi:hypothetical protein